MCGIELVSLLFLYERVYVLSYVLVFLEVYSRRVLIFRIKVMHDGKMKICAFRYVRKIAKGYYYLKLLNRFSKNKFCAHGSVHRKSTLKCSKMTLFVRYFVPCEQLYMFRVKHSPIIRSSNKLSLHLVVTNSSDSSKKTAGHILSVTTRCSNYSLFELLMTGECFTRNMYSCLQEIKYCTKVSSCWKILKFSKNTQTSNFMKPRPVGAEFFHAGRPTGGQTDKKKLIIRVAFCNFWNVPNNTDFHFTITHYLNSKDQTRLL
jgi:hypothetical protein